MGRFRTSLALAKASWQVLREDPKLSLLPVISGILTMIVAASFAVPVWLTTSTATAADGTTSAAMAPVGWVLMFLGYVAAAFVVVFFNAALVYAADAHLHGHRVTLGEALRFAAGHSRVLLPWAIVSATVSMILRAISQRAGFVGQIVVALVGAAWSLVTFMVLPVLVVEGIGPFAAVKRSATLFKQTWGEQMISNGGIGLIAFLGVLVGILPGIAVAVLGASASSVPLVIVGVFLIVAVVIGVSVIASALIGILSMALYRYATGGEVLGFDTAQIQGAFGPKKNRS